MEISRTVLEAPVPNDTDAMLQAPEPDKKCVPVFWGLFSALNSLTTFARFWTPENCLSVCLSFKIGKSQKLHGEL